MPLKRKVERMKRIPGPARWLALIIYGFPGDSEKATVSPRPSECRKLFANLSEYLDARVERTCERIRAHIEKCKACVAFLRVLRAAMDRCHSLQVGCDAGVAERMRALMTQEYLRLHS